MLALLVGSITLASPAQAGTITLTGVVACEGSHEVVGLWVYSSAGGSKWATLSSISARWIKKYSVSVPSSTNVRLDVGCGGTSSSWWSTNRTDLKAIPSSHQLSATCQEASGAPARRCSVWGATVFVGMPFAGVWNRYGLANPSTHKVYDSMGIADWSTDLFAAPGTAVRPRIYAPMNGSPYDLKVINTWSGCAGKGVRVGIYKSGSLIGTVSYAHLDAVPSFSAGQKISTTTTLGKLKRWTNCSGWSVSSNSGVHTHIEVGTKNGKACAMAYGAGKSLIDTRKIGRIRPDSTASC